MKLSHRLQAILADPAVYYALIIFVVARVLLSTWAVIVLALYPPPTESDEILRPYLGESRMSEGLAGWLLGPWQRFDTLHYLRIARQGYIDAGDSVFPPLYPLATRGLGALLAYGLQLVTGASHLAISQSNLLAGLLLSNLACLGSLILLYRLVAAEMNTTVAIRTLIYLVTFPTAFFLFAAYTEPLFLLFALGSLWTARRGQFWPAGVLGLLAALTRLAGWAMIVPLAYEYLRQRDFDRHRLDWAGLAVLLPPLGLAGFLAWRWWAGLPSLDEVYSQYWGRTPGFLGADLLTAINLILTGQGSWTLLFNFFCALLLLTTTFVVFRRLAPLYGLYGVIMLFFILLPNSSIIPLYSLSRFTLTFFPTFIVLGLAGHQPWLNRLILYPSLALLFFFSGQFFIWGWTA